MTDGRTGIKICGISRPEDTAVLNRLLPEYAGFVFAEKSRRYVSPSEAKRLREMLDGRIKTAGVFVNADFGLIEELLQSGTVSLIQLHGDEDEEYIGELRRRLGRISEIKYRIIKAFSISGAEDIVRAEKSTADYILLDNGAGGTGQSFGTELLRDNEPKRPYFLAGGLTPGNVREHIRGLHPYAVDVSSGTETNGIKDPYKTEEFIRNVREA